MTEGPPSRQDRSTQLIQRLLGNRGELKRLLDVGTGKDTRTWAGGVMRNFTPNELTSLAGQLVYAQGQETNFWDVDRRDGALALLREVPLGAVNSTYLRDVYVRAIHSQGKEADPFGTIDALLNTGEILYTHLPPDETTQQAVKHAWDTVAENMQGNPDWLAVEPKVAEVKIIFEAKKKDTSVDTDQTVSKTPRKVKRPRSSISLEIIARRQEVAVLRNTDMTYPEIAQRLNTTITKVTHDIVRLREQGVAVKKGKIAPHEIADLSPQMAALRNAGKTYREIAEELGTTITKVNHYLARLREQGVDIKKGRGIFPEIAARRQEVAALRNSGEPPREIAQKLRVSRTIVKRDITILRAQGIIG